MANEIKSSFATIDYQPYCFLGYIHNINRMALTAHWQCITEQMGVVEGGNKVKQLYIQYRTYYCLCCTSTVINSVSQYSPTTKVHGCFLFWQPH